ncbi:hypothetical protein [Blautia intestinalis]|uniref:hypothetical protein n=1 Tax=Blautia intestinalis TaxID=2763028 RepID=UPI0022E04149|nr:hypothetical protein [Blautia intestinalis]
MQIINQGGIEVPSEFETLLIVISDAAGFKEYDKTNIVVDRSKAILSLEEEYGDIEAKLSKIVDAFAALDIYIDVNVDYFGDYEGRYIVRDKKLVDLDEDEVVIMESNDDVLIKELESRGYTVTKENK